jgi:carbon-monoxide dehydrogenase medium subunit
VRVRNVATVGGLLAEADYASDPPPVLLVLNAEVDVAGPHQVRSIPVTEFFHGFFETALAADELVTGVRIPLPPPRAYGVYEKFVTRSAEDRPCVGVAAQVELAPDAEMCVDLRVAVGAAAETPQRLPDVEALARGQQLTPDVIRTVAEKYAASIDTLSDLRGSAWYRTEMIRVWVRRSIERARDGAATSRGQPG